MTRKDILKDIERYKEELRQAEQNREYWKYDKLNRTIMLLEDEQDLYFDYDYKACQYK